MVWSDLVVYAKEFMRNPTNNVIALDPHKTWFFSSIILLIGSWFLGFWLGLVLSLLSWWCLLKSVSSGFVYVN